MPEPALDRALEALYGKPTPEPLVIKLRGDASTRSYFRVQVSGAPHGTPSTVIAMLLPKDAFGSDEGGGATPTTRLPFLEVLELLKSRGIRVPDVHVEDLDRRIVLLEDLGDVTLHEALQETAEDEWLARYREAVDLLAEMHDRCEELPTDSIVARRRFDRELLQWELDHFREWGLEALFGPTDPATSEVLREAWSTLVDTISAMPEGFVHRDYQSKNLMQTTSGELAVIDFQDALRGPRVYDLVALLCDSYVALPEGLQDAMIDRYAALRRIDAEALRHEFWHVAIHRKLKDAGRFIYIDRVRKNPDFLRWFPQSLVYVGRALDHVPSLAALGAELSAAIPGFPDAVSIPESTVE